MIVSRIFLFVVLWKTDLGRNVGCINCKYENMLMDQQPLTRGMNSECSRNNQYPCRDCEFKTPCHSGVKSLIDGCGCCMMCARQQGDLCNHRDVCDDSKNLLCQKDSNGQGICMSKTDNPCHFENGTYRDGQEFSPDCKRRCICQGERVACVSTCPHEYTPPSSPYCSHPQLVTIEGRCCKEWSCPFPAIQPGSGAAVTSPSKNWLADPAQIKPGECKISTSEWSPCSATCDVGLSMRVTNDNDKCQQTQQRRLCIVRPCNLGDHHTTGSDCKSTWKSNEEVQIQLGDCRTAKGYKPKYCSTCKLNRCCLPDRTKTIMVEFQCINGTRIFELFMWLKSCDCIPC